MNIACAHYPIQTLLSVTVNEDVNDCSGSKNKATANNNTAIKKMAIFLVVAPRSLVEVRRCFRGPCCLQSSTRLRGTTAKKSAVFGVTAVKTSNTTEDKEIYMFRENQNMWNPYLQLIKLLIPCI